MLRPWSNLSIETRIANEKIISLPPLITVVRVRAVVSLSRFRATAITTIIAEEVRADC
jgi:hypothetical protein